jgi:acetylornithine deacetylase/succinyl-diaminopimelate desuccinylase-like protein
MTSSVHSADERIEVASLVRTYEALRRFLEEVA